MSCLVCTGCIPLIRIPGVLLCRLSFDGLINLYQLFECGTCKLKPCPRSDAPSVGDGVPSKSALEITHRRACKLVEQPETYVWGNIRCKERARLDYHRVIKRVAPRQPRAHASRKRVGCTWRRFEGHGCCFRQPTNDKEVGINITGNGCPCFFREEWRRRVQIGPKLGDS